MPQRKSSVTKRGNAAAKRYGKTMKGTGGKAKPSVSVKPKGTRGVTVKVKY